MIDKDINFIQFFKLANIFSLIIFLLSIIFIIFKGLNYGIDFKGGTLIELRVDKNTTNISDIRSAFRNMDLGDVNIKEFGKKGDYITSPNISILFSEMIAVWIVSFWQNLGCPKKFNLIEKNLNRYNSIFLNKINLKYIVLCENLSVSEISAAGVPNYKKKTLIIDINFNDDYFERVIHHEIFHLINDLSI